MSWGVVGGQEDYYKQARSVTPKEIQISRVIGVCKKCHCVELAPTNDTESANGGLMVPRKGLTFINEKGHRIVHLRASKDRKINHYWGCNHCVNKW